MNQQDLIDKLMRIEVECDDFQLRSTDTNLSSFYAGRKSLIHELLDNIRECKHLGQPEKIKYKNTPVEIYSPSLNRRFTSIRSASKYTGIPLSTIAKTIKSTRTVEIDGIKLEKR